MKVEIEGNEIRIMGKNLGVDKHLHIYVNEEHCKDEFVLSTVVGKFRIGDLPNIIMDHDNIILSDHGVKKIIS